MIPKPKGRGRMWRGTPAERFWAKVDKRGPSDCWPWLWSRTGKMGYGVFSVEGIKHTRAHRVAYELASGPIPSGAHVLHRCDNPPCCNPAHLFLGTNTENIADKVAKGRQRGAPGERHGMAKITDAQEAEIRATCATGELPSAVGRRFGLSYSQVWRIVRGQRGATPPRAGRIAPKLTEAMVREIRTSTEPCVAVAGRLGINKATVSKIRRRAIWRHVV